MNKKEVQKRVLQNGKPLALSKFTWCEKTKTFSSTENDLVLDFRDVHGCTFKTGSNCTFDTGSGCTFKTGSGCTFKTGYNCTFDTGYNCTFNAGSGCTFNTEFDCTFDTGFGCVIANRNVFEVIKPNVYDIIQICPDGIEGHLVNGMYNGEPHIIADGILSKIVSQKGSVYKVINHGDTETTYLIKQGEVYSHGKTPQEARDSLVYKLSDRDTSKYEGYTLDTELDKSECIQMYMAITGACAEGARYFVDNNPIDKDKFTVAEIVKLTQGQYGNETFKEFFV